MLRMEGVKWMGKTFQLWTVISITGALDADYFSQVTEEGIQQMNNKSQTNNPSDL